MARPQTWAPGSAGVLDYTVQPGGPVISAEARLVYLALFSHMGDSFTCRPSVSRLAQGTGLAERTVRYKLKELEGSGLLQRSFPQGQSTTYLLFPPWVAAEAPPLHQVPPGMACPTAPDAGGEGQEVQAGGHGVQEGAASGAPKVTHRSNPSKKPKRSNQAGGDSGYTPEFENWWSIYPRRDEKKKACRVYQIAVRNGATHDQLAISAKNYALYVQGREQRHIKLAATFLGPDEHWKEYLEPRVTTPPGAGQYRKGNAFDKIQAIIEQAEAEEGRV